MKNELPLICSLQFDHVDDEEVKFVSNPVMFVVRMNVFAVEDFGPIRLHDPGKIQAA